MINLVEMVTDKEEQTQAPCKYGNIVEGHACYCHNEKAPYRKCPQWRNGEPYEECKYFNNNK